MASTRDFPVTCARVGVGLSWDPSQGHTIDLDLQAIAFDSQGKPLDAVYYNNLKALGKAMTHSGDETSGEKSGFDEVVWIGMRHLREEVAIVAFVVACHSGGSLCHVANGKIFLVEDKDSNVVASFDLENSAAQVDLVGALVRSSGSGWAYRELEMPAQRGQHFMDILEPTLGNFVRSVLPSAPRRIKAAFAMEKGQVVDLPASDVIKSVSAGLGWDTSCGEVDLDVSAILFNQGGTELTTVFFGRLSAEGVTHSGDNLTGAGDGDDEVITIDLTKVGSKVHQVVFVINIYSQGFTFVQVANPYCHIASQAGEELCRFSLREAGREQSLIVARLFREPGNLRWGFQAIGVPCRGRMYKDALPIASRYARMTAREVQQGVPATSASTGPDSVARSRSVPLVGGPGAAGNECCTVQ